MGYIRRFREGFSEGFSRANSSVRYERIDTVEQLQHHIFGDDFDTSGQIVNPSTAMQANAVASSIRVLTSIYGATPCVLFRSLKDGGREQAKDHPLYDLILHKPNSWQSPMTFQETGKFYDSMRGSTRAWINRISTGRIMEMILLYPDYLTVKQMPDYSLHYEYRFPGRDLQRFTQSEVLNIPGLSYNGYDGLSPIGYARQSIGGALGAQKFGNNVWKHGSFPGVSVRYPLIKDETLRKELKEEFERDYGDGNWHKPIVGWGADFEIKGLGLTSEDIQFLDTRKFQRTEIATGIYGVPGNFIGDLEGSTYSNIEQQNLAFLTATMATHFKRTEQAYNVQLLTRQERTTGGLYFEFVDDWLLRGDLKDRTAAIRSAILTGTLSPNEGRTLLKLNPYEGGDTKYMPLNMAPVDLINAETDLKGRVGPQIDPEELQ